MKIFECKIEEILQQSGDVRIRLERISSLKARETLDKENLISCFFSAERQFRHEIHRPGANSLIRWELIIDAIIYFKNQSYNQLQFKVYILNKYMQQLYWNLLWRHSLYSFSGLSLAVVKFEVYKISICLHANLTTI